MRIIPFISLKGGAGKTTALQILSSSLVARGRKVGLVESDENAPLGRWRHTAVELGTWDDRCTIYPGGNVDMFLDSAVAADAAEEDYLLVDTHGGYSELNNAAIINSQLVIVPTSVTAIDTATCVDTIEFLANLRKAEQLETLAVTILVTRCPLQMTKSQEASKDRLNHFKVLGTILRDRDAFGSLASNGMLHLSIERRRSQSAFLATHLQSAMREADALADELETILR